MSNYRSKLQSKTTRKADASTLEYAIAILGVVALVILAVAGIGGLILLGCWISGWIWLHVAYYFQIYVYDFGWEVPFNHMAYIFTGLVVWLIGSLFSRGSSSSSK